MQKEEFYSIRLELEKTQRQLSEILGTSLKAVQSFEQGWRNIPPHVERQMFFLLAMKRNRGNKLKACWDILGCEPERRMRCPAWEFNIGELCWFINGTICKGRPRGSWSTKMKICRKCDVFRKNLGTLA